MTIASTNIGFSTIAAEKGIGNSNLSLKELSGKEVKHDCDDAQGTSSQYGTYDLTMGYGGITLNRSSGVVTSAQGQGTAGLNSSPYSMSEWVGYDPVDRSKFGNYTGTSTNQAPIFVSEHLGAQSCWINVGCVNDVYAQKVGNAINIYVTETTSGVLSGDATVLNGAGGVTSLSSGATFIGAVSAGTNQVLPTGCVMSVADYRNTGTGGFFGATGSTSTVPSGATSTTNLGSTKIGYRVQSGGASEGGAGTTSEAHYIIGVVFRWILPTSPSGDTHDNNYTEILIHQKSTATHSGSGWNPC
jgi:hypothetical protein